MRRYLLVISAVASVGAASPVVLPSVDVAAVSANQAVSDALSEPTAPESLIPELGDPPVDGDLESTLVDEPGDAHGNQPKRHTCEECGRG